MAGPEISCVLSPKLVERPFLYSSLVAESVGLDQRAGQTNGYFLFQISCILVNFRFFTISGNLYAEDHRSKEPPGSYAVHGRRLDLAYGLQSMEAWEQS